MNQTVINDVFPILIPAIAKKNKIDNMPINVFAALGGNEILSQLTFVPSKTETIKRVDANTFVTNKVVTSATLMMLVIKSWQKQ